MSDKPIARYSFLPWLRQGMVNSINLTDNLGTGPSGQGERAKIDVRLEINNNSDTPVLQPIAIFGPGDVTSIDPRAVVRTDPGNGITDFEENYLALIEFYAEDFPWRYTPAKAAGNRLRPWICLWVLEEGEYEDVRVPGRPALSIRVLDPGITLPKPTETWAWAHVHANRDLTPSPGDGIEQALINLETILQKDADLAYSRLICPRRLKPNSRYSAFVVPTFENGRLTGLGQDIPDDSDSLLPAWGNGQNEFPVYYRWSFRTGSTGDFEYLVRLLQPRVMGPEVGIRPMDVQNPAPEYSIPGISDPPELGLEGALRSPQTESTPWPPDPPATVPFRQMTAQLLNLPEDLKLDGNTADPLVVPPIYGRWHAATQRVQVAGNPPWLDALNLDPRHRTVSGFGTQVVQINQEEYMQEAWKQVDQIDEVNRRMRFAQLAREVSLAFYRKHLTPLDDGRLLSISSPLLGRVLASPVTIQEKLRNSTLPPAAVDPAFRRVLRSRGPVVRRNPAAGGIRMGRVLERLSQGKITAAKPKKAPEKQIEPGDLTDQFYPEWLPKWFRPYIRWLRWIAIGGGLIALVLTCVMAAFSGWLAAFFGAAALGAFSAAVYLQRQDKDWQAGETLRESGLSAKQVQRTPPRPDFQITKAGELAQNPGNGGSDSPEATKFRRALLDLHERFEVKLPVEPNRIKLPLQPLRASLVHSLNPNRTVRLRLLSQVQIANYLIERPDPIEPIMDAPDIPFPMYKPLRDISPELMVPNLNLIPQNTITLLETNQPFIEAYMVGVNHEMAREFKWREYPTDQRGSPMRQFWDVNGVVNTEVDLPPDVLAESLKDIKPIHAWRRTAELGMNGRFGPDSERLVLVIRGDLLKKYPNAVIYAAEARWPDNPLEPQRELTENEKYPLFGAEIAPDLTFLGFDLKEEEAKGSPNRGDNQPGWFFVIKERPGEPRFGLDAADRPATSRAEKWDDLSWGHLAATEAEFQGLSFVEVTEGMNPNQPKLPHNTVISENPDSVFWGTNSAEMAHILYQVPVLVAVHAEEMLE